MNILEEIRADAQGAAILADWLGDGGVPVPVPHAEQRAYTCLYCPENLKDSWWERVKTMLADNIRQAMAVKARMNLHVTQEANIGTCKVCHCNLPLSVWCPIEHIKSHTTQEQLAKFPSHCWKPTEIKR